MGTKDDEEKPKFASLRPHQRMDALTLPEALELFKLPRTVGNMPDGHAIRVAIGRFGPYVQYGAKKFVSIKDDDPYTVELPRALELITRQGRARRESHHPRFPRRRHPGAERPLRSVHHRSREERQDPQGSRAEDADAGRVQGADRRRARARQGPLRQIREEDGGDAAAEAAAAPQPRSRHEGGSEGAKTAPAKTAKAPAKAAAQDASEAAAKTPAKTRRRRRRRRRRSAHRQK